jgi:hypothetical protein
MWGCKKGGNMKKKDKEAILKQYGINIPDEALKGAEKATKIYNQSKQKEENRILKIEVESLQKEVEELKKYKWLWEKIKETDFGMTGEEQCDECGHENLIKYTETIEHQFNSILEYTDFMERRYLQEEEEKEDN